MVMINQIEKTSPIKSDKDNENKFPELYNCYFSRVYNYVRYRIADFHAAEDVTSQIFLKAFSRLKYYQEEKASFATWIFSIARNAITDYYRMAGRSNFTSLEITGDLVNSEPGPVEIILGNETQQQLLQALVLLSQRERDIIALKFWGGFSNREIAQLVDISESNTGVVLFRAMRRLRKILESQGMSTFE